MQSEQFTAHGVYSWSNCCGCYVMLSNSGDAAKLKFNDDNGTETDWLEIEYIEDEDEQDEEGNNVFNPVIDPEKHNVPLNQVMRM